MLNQVLVALDETKESENAIQYAIDFIAPAGTIVLTRIISPQEIVEVLEETPYETIGFDSAESGSSTNKKLSDAEHYLASLANAMPESMKTEIQVQSGRPDIEIVKIAENKHVQAIIMCSGCYPTLKYWRLGTVAAKVLKSAHCPVVLIPHQHEH